MLRPLAAAAALLWWNAYLVRQAFSIPFMGQMHSMHGYWEAVGRLASEHGWLGSWIDAFAGGMPIEWAYAPLVPFLANLAGVPPVNALAFCIGPVALSFLAWRITGRLQAAFAIGAVYTLLSPVEWIDPDGVFAWARILEPRRMYVTFAWDETPHELALACVCLATAAWTRGQWRLAAAAIAAGALASPFAITGCALFALCWLASHGWRHWRIVAVTGALGYCIVAPWYSPSLLATIRRNGALTPESAWTDTSPLAVLLAGSVFAAAVWLSRRWAPASRFALLLAVLMTSIPVLFTRWGLRFLDQPGRYKTELELACAFALGLAFARLPRWPRRAAAALALVLAVYVTIEQRRYSKRFLVPASRESFVEFQSAQWASRHLPGRTVFAPGSIAQWWNAFGGGRQFSGGSYTTAPNPEQQRIASQLLAETDPDTALALLRLARVDAVIAAGPASPEFWRQLQGKDIFAGRLPLLWRERDTSIYAVPGGGGPPFTAPFHERLEFRLCRWLSLFGIILFATPLPGRYQIAATSAFPLNS